MWVQGEAAQYAGGMVVSRIVMAAGVVVCLGVVFSAAPARRSRGARLVLGVEGRVDSVRLHYEGLYLCTQADTVDSCDALLPRDSYTEVIEGLGELRQQHFLERPHCCGERRYAYLEVVLGPTEDADTPFVSFSPVRVYLWACDLDRGFVFINEQCFVVRFSQELTATIESTLAENAVQVLTLKGKARALTDLAQKRKAVTPYVDHVNSFPKRLLAAVEGTVPYGQPVDGELQGLSGLVQRMKTQAKHIGLRVVWDEEKSQYLIEEAEN